MKFILKILMVIVVVFALLIVRFALLPEAIKNEIAIKGMYNRYFSVPYSDDPEVRSLLYRGFFRPIRNFNQMETAQLLQILDDSSSYVRGQLATVSFDQKLYFLDEFDHLTMVTFVGQDGQTYTHPDDTVKRKYGLLKNEKWALLESILY